MALGRERRYVEVFDVAEARVSEVMGRMHEFRSLVERPAIDDATTYRPGVYWIPGCRKLIVDTDDRAALAAIKGAMLAMKD